MKAYLDASALTSLLLIDSGSGAVERWIADATGLVARPEFGLRPPPDALHIAVARRIGQLLVTRDQQQFSAAQAIGVRAINSDRPE